jgi:hypothetical protein
MQLDTITKLLNIPNQKVMRIVKDTEDRFEFLLELVEEDDPVRSGCGRFHNTYAHSRGYKLLRISLSVGKGSFFM